MYLVGSNPIPHPEKIQIPHPWGADDGQMPMGYPGGRILKFRFD